MNYAWEVLLQADAQGIPRERMRFLPDRKGSPYMEASFTDINTRELSGLDVDVNPLFRFSAVFSWMLDENLTELPELRRILFDMAMHLFTQQDLRQGLCKDEYYLRFILRDLTECFGEETAKQLSLLTTEELRGILACLLILYQTGTSVLLFRRAVKELYAQSIVYASNDTFRDILIYLGAKQTEKGTQRVNFLLSFFLPLNYTVHLFWEKHFGIIGVEEAMKMDEIMLF